jgi:hypothetical protein
MRRRYKIQWEDTIGGDYYYYYQELKHYNNYTIFTNYQITQLHKKKYIKKYTSFKLSIRIRT